jgi:hypothetical protein
VHSKVRLLYSARYNKRYVKSSGRNWICRASDLMAPFCLGLFRIIITRSLCSTTQGASAVSMVLS